MLKSIKQAKPAQEKPRCPICRCSRTVTKHSRHTRPDGTKYNRWLCRSCCSTFVRSCDRRRVGNYRRGGNR